MNWRVETRRMVGRKTEPVAVIELSGEELELLQAGFDDGIAANVTRQESEINLDLAAALSAVEDARRERAFGRGGGRL